jgi:hypothetical protein
VADLLANDPEFRAWLRLPRRTSSEDRYTCLADLYLAADP